MVERNALVGADRFAPSPDDAELTTRSEPMARCSVPESTVGWDKDISLIPTGPFRGSLTAAYPDNEHTRR